MPAAHLHGQLDAGLGEGWRDGQGVASGVQCASVRAGADEVGAAAASRSALCDGRSRACLSGPSWSQLLGIPVRFVLDAARNPREIALLLAVGRVGLALDTVLELLVELLVDGVLLREAQEQHRSATAHNSLAGIPPAAAGDVLVAASYAPLLEQECAGHARALACLQERLRDELKRLRLLSLEAGRFAALNRGVATELAFECELAGANGGGGGGGGDDKGSGGGGGGNDGSGAGCAGEAARPEHYVASAMAHQKGLLADAELLLCRRAEALVLCGGAGHDRSGAGAAASGGSAAALTLAGYEALLLAGGSGGSGCGGESATGLEAGVLLEAQQLWQVTGGESCWPAHFVERGRPPAAAAAPPPPPPPPPPSASPPPQSPPALLLVRQRDRGQEEPAKRRRAEVQHDEGECENRAPGSSQEHTLSLSQSQSPCKM